MVVCQADFLGAQDRHREQAPPTGSALDAHSVGAGLPAIAVDQAMQGSWASSPASRLPTVDRVLSAWAGRV